MDVKYPDVRVLLHEDDTALAVMGAVCKALMRAGHRDAVQPYVNAASQGTHEDMRAETKRWVTCVSQG